MDSLLPEKTKYRTLFRFTKSFWLIDGESRWRFYHNFASFYPFTFYMAIIVVSFVYYAKKSSGLMYYPILAMLVLSMSCFYRTRYTNPGTLPWYWASSKRKMFTVDEMYQGTAHTEEQVKYAKTHERPNRASFSSTYGYFILRADHQCKFLGCWIGLKNHRYFILGCIYTMCYLATLFVCLLIDSTALYKDFMFYADIAAIIYFTTVLVPQLRTQFKYILGNETQMEVRKDLPNVYNKSWKENLCEVFGSPSYWFLWPLPVEVPMVCDGFSFPDREEETANPIESLTTFESFSQIFNPQN